MSFLNKHWENNHSIFVRFMGFLFSEKCAFIHQSMPRQKDGRFSLTVLSGDFEDRICKILDMGILKQEAGELVFKLLLM